MRNHRNFSILDPRLMENPQRESFFGPMEMRAQGRAVFRPWAQPRLFLESKIFLEGRLWLDPEHALSTKVVWRIEDALRGRTTARPPLVNGHGLGSRPLCLTTADKTSREYV